ncbi:MAG: hypothetical protein LBG44_05430 [Gemmatimonadota bacterium]|nr:hypothetical protein [Gemmatimonadota bacterium]
MIPFNLLILPLLGGYYLVTYWNFTRFKSQRYSGERLIFHAGIAGTILLLLSAVISSVFAWWEPDAADRLKAFLPSFDYSGTTLLAFFLGLVAPCILNLISTREIAINKAILEMGGHLEQLLESSALESRQILVSLKSGKVYVGWAITNFNPSSERKFIQLLPLSSGFRSLERHEVVFTTDYARVYLQMVEEDSSQLEEEFEEAFKKTLNNFRLVIPVTEISSANFFDPEAYDRFNAPVESTIREPEDPLPLLIATPI